MPRHFVRLTRPASDERVARLVAHIERLRERGLSIRPRHEPYGHMGATLSEVALQARWKYKTHVRPRAKHVRDTYPDADTTSGFLRVIAQEGSVQKVLNTTSDKALIALELAGILTRRRIETEEQLRDWITQPGSRERLLRVKGVGPKATDYLAIRVGVQDVVAVDAHVRQCLRDAGIAAESYDDAASVVAAAARTLGYTPADLEGAIWRYQEGLTQADE